MHLSAIYTEAITNVIITLLKIIDHLDPSRFPVMKSSLAYHTCYANELSLPIKPYNNYLHDSTRIVDIEIMTCAWTY